ncbi:MAG: dihydroneopterin aldolase [Fimbriimonadia bacterium]
MTDHIRIEGIEFYAHHGVSEEERSVGHRYWADLSVYGDFRAACTSDRLEDTISYSKLARMAVEIGTSERFALLEKLAETMAERVLRDDERIAEVEVTVGKLHPPARAVVHRAAVVLRRTRSDFGLPERGV